MKIKLKIEKEIEVKYLKVSAGVRCWEDATINGVEDEDGTLIPFRNEDRWEPLIDVDEGKIIDWPEGTIADIHYKICDDGNYLLFDENKVPITSIDGYVPNIMCPKEDGYGDYIIMDINSAGNIQKWNPRNMQEFEETK